MIKEFFEDKEIFITGGSGVVGKALIEKLLRSCNVRKIYTLMRSKKQQTIEERFKKLKNSMIFRQLKLKKPDELDSKLQYIPGDALWPLLGISPEHQKTLENVSILFHCAATVRFDEPLKHAIKLNVGGTLQMLKFAEKLTNLEVVMHVSTFFSNPYLKRVEEKVYKSPMDWRLCLRLLEQNDITEEEIDIISRKLIIGFPNTYCFTKNLAESLVNDHRHTLPVAIYRPSVVLFALEEPEPAFAPSLMGAMGMFAVTGAGLLKTLHINPDTMLDISPQDIAVKGLCFYTMKSANFYANTKRVAQVPVFLVSLYTHSNLSFSQYIGIMQDFGLWNVAAFEKNLLIPGIYCTKSQFLYTILFVFKQLLPALLVDFVMILIGRKPVLLSAQRKIFTSLEVMKPFIFNSYESPGTTDFKEMIDKYTGTEFDMSLLSQTNNFFSNIRMCENVGYTVREHLLQEDPKTLPRSRKILKAKIFMYNIVKFLLAFKVWQKLLDYFENGN